MKYLGEYGKVKHRIKFNDPAAWYFVYSRTPEVYRKTKTPELIFTIFTKHKDNRVVCINPIKTGNKTMGYYYATNPNKLEPTIATYKTKLSIHFPKVDDLVFILTKNEILKHVVIDLI